MKAQEFGQCEKVLQSILHRRPCETPSSFCLKVQNCMECIRAITYLMSLAQAAPLAFHAVSQVDHLTLI